MSINNINKLKSAMLGQWASLAPEVRPSKNPDGSLRPFYLSRRFVYLADDRFELTVTNHVDPYGEVAIATIDIAGHVSWHGDHPIAPGAQKVDFVADERYAVTPLAQVFVDLLNKIAVDGYVPWTSGQTQSIFRKSFALFGLVKENDFKEHDLVYVTRDLLFWGARNVDGRGFDAEADRPTNLQIPLARA